MKKVIHAFLFQGILVNLSRVRKLADRVTVVPLVNLATQGATVLLPK